MGIMRRIAEKIQSYMPTPSALTGGQLAVDSNYSALGISPKMWVAYKREQRIATYANLLTNVPIVKAITSTLTKLVMSGDFSADTGDSMLDNDLNAILSSVQIDKVLSSMLMNLLVFGYVSAEVCLSDDVSSLSRIVVIDSSQVRYVTDQQGTGTISTVLQYVTGHPKTGHRWAGQNRPVGLSSVYPIASDLGKVTPHSFL